MPIRTNFRAMAAVTGTIIALSSIIFPATVLAASPCPYTWDHGMSMGDIGDNVLKLQQFLNADRLTVISATGPGSPGNETTKFGALTKKAVVTFQEEYASEILTPNGLSVGTGKVGISTKAKLNSLCAKGIQAAARAGSVLGVSTTTVIASDILTINIPEQPDATLAPANALYVPFTKVTLTAGSKDVTVSSVAVSRVGPSKNAAFAALDLFMDEDSSYASTAYLGSNNSVVFKDEFTVPAGQSRTIVVTGEMAADLTDYDGQIATFQVDAIESSSPIVGSLPVRGTPQTINNSLIIGSATAMLSSYDPGTDQTKYVNETNIRFAGIRVTAGSTEKIRINSITWTQAGTASGSDISNVVVVVNGTSYPTTVDGRSYSAVFPKDIDIDKGLSVEAYIQGDIGVTGSNRTVKFDLQYATDVDITGLTYGYGIYLLPGGNTAIAGNSVFLTDTGDTDGVSLTPFFSGASILISPGAASFIGR